MPPVQILLIAAAAGALWFGGKEAVKGVKVVDRKVCHVFTLGHKCKTKPAATPQEKK